MEPKENKNYPADILALLHTKAETDHFIQQIDSLSESLFSKKTDVKGKMNELFSSEMVVTIEHTCRTIGLDITNIIALQHFLSQLKDVIKKTPNVCVTLAFKPNQKITQRIYDWLCFRLKQRVIIDVKVEKHLIGGAIIEFQGKHYEYSLHIALSEKLLALSKNDKNVQPIKHN